MKPYIITTIVISIIAICFSVVRVSSGEDSNEKDNSEVSKKQNETSYRGTKTFYEKDNLWYYTLTIFKNHSVRLLLYVPSSDNYKHSYPDHFPEGEDLGYEKDGKIFIENKVKKNGDYYLVKDGTYDSITFKLENGNFYRMEKEGYEEYQQKD